MRLRESLIGWSASMVWVAVLVAGQGPASDFQPDSTFQGSSLTGWRVVGDATWRAENGEIVASIAQGARGGWLVLDKSYQDVDFFTRFRCTAGCQAGILFRMENTADGSTGVYVSLTDGDLATYRLTLDAGGRERAREKLRPGGPFVRVAPPKDVPARTGGAGRGGSPMPFPTTLPELMPPAPGLRPNDWNSISVTLDADIVRPVLNLANDIATGATEDRAAGYGSIALFAGGSGEVRFKDVSFKDLNRRVIPAEATSSRFRLQQLDEFYYAWGAAAADFNRDGVIDVVAGPYYYLGPDYTTRREIYVTPTLNPSTQFPPMIDFAWDFTGDGWPDVLAGESRPMSLYVNPKGEPRRWMKHSVLPQVTSELALLKDLDADGAPEVVFATGGAGGTLMFGKPDPANPTAPWNVYPISEPGPVYHHSMGAGDINGDGRMDVLQTAGWWEQPAGGGTRGPWAYHPEAFGRWGRAEGAGGAELTVFDVNGDGLNDVVTSLNAHGWGLAWFEQKRDSGGRISFERHMIMDDYSTKNAGGVVFSEMHASAAADVDGDGVTDFVTGKRYWSHLDSYTDPDPYGPPVLYWFRTVRNRKAPGGAELIPELIHNRSGVGSQFSVVDLNKDGAVDIVTSTNRGTFIFWGQRRPAPRR